MAQEPPVYTRHYFPANVPGFDPNAYMAGGAGVNVAIDPALQFRPGDYAPNQSQLEAEELFRQLYTLNAQIDPNSGAYTAEMLGTAPQLGGAPQVATNFGATPLRSRQDIEALGPYAPASFDPAAQYMPATVDYDGARTIGALGAQGQMLAGSGITSDQQRALELQLAAASGQGPSQAQQQQLAAASDAAGAFRQAGADAGYQYQRSADQAARQQMALAAGARGSMSGLAMLNAQNNTAALQADAANQAAQAQLQSEIQASRALETGGYNAAALRAQEQLGALNQYGATAGDIRNQNLSQAAAYNQLTSQAAGLDAQSYQAALANEQARAQAYADYAARQQQADVLGYQTAAQSYQDYAARQLAAQQFNVSSSDQAYQNYAQQAMQAQQLNAEQQRANQAATAQYALANQGTQAQYATANQQAANQAAANNQQSLAQLQALRQQGMLSGASTFAGQANQNAAQGIQGIQDYNAALSHRADRVSNWDVQQATTGMQVGAQLTAAREAEANATNDALIGAGGAVVSGLIASSDRRMKNIQGRAQNADFTGVHDYNYRYRPGTTGPGVDGREHIGPMAQDLPDDTVTYDANGNRVVDGARLAMRLASAVGELQRRKGK